MTDPKDDKLAQKRKSAQKKKRHLEGIHTPLEQKLLAANLVRLTTLGGTTLTAPISFIDRYNLLMGNVVIPKHAVELYEIDPDPDEEDEGES